MIKLNLQLYILRHLLQCCEPRSCLEYSGAASILNAWLNRPYVQQFITIRETVTRGHYWFQFQQSSLIVSKQNGRNYEYVTEIESELDEQKSTILKNGEKVTEQVTQNINGLLEEKFAILEGKYENLKEKLENQERR